MIVYNKLIRDRIPEAVVATGKSCEVRVLDEQAFPEALRVKLQEELKEYLESSKVEELADLLEVVYALAQLEGVSRDGLEAIRMKKADERGGFEKRLFLVSVSE